MIDMIESLMKGEATYASALTAAKAFWVSFFAEHADDGEEQLQAALESAQAPYQWAVEKVGLVAPLAKSIMVLTAVGALYNDGFDDPELARRALRGFSRSKTLSLGIGSSAPAVAQLYGLGDFSR